MKYFKMMSNYHADNRVKECLHKLGHEGFTVWAIMLSIMGEQYRGETEKTFIIYAPNLAQSCRIYRPKLDQTLTKLGLIFNLTWSKVDDNYHIQYPKFLKLQQKYQRDGGGKFTAIEENRIEEKRVEEKNPLTPLTGGVKEKQLDKKDALCQYKQMAIEILKVLNAKANKNFRPVDSTLKPIIARLKEGYTKNEILNVMAYKANQDFFIQNPHFINPVTLLRKEKFQITLDEVKNG